MRRRGGGETPCASATATRSRSASCAARATTAATASSSRATCTWRVSASSVCCAAAPESTTADARTMRAAATAFGVPEGSPEAADVLVDALFGSGFRGRLEGAAEALVLRANGLAAPIVALDVPSGVDGASGRVEGVAARRRPDARVPRPLARDGDRARPRPRRRGRGAADRPAGRAGGPAARRCASILPISPSCRRARRAGTKYDAGGVLVVGGSPGHERRTGAGGARRRCAPAPASSGPACPRASMPPSPRMPRS